MAASKLDELKSNNYALRNITAINKYYTLLVDNEIFVGPFKGNVVDRIKDRAALLKEWNTPYICHPIAVDDGEWMVYENFTVGHTPDDTQKKLNETKGFWIDHFNDIRTLNEVCESESWIYDTPDLLLTYVHLWLLNVGNSLFTDTFVDMTNRDLHIMDYDLERMEKSATETAYFYFTKAPPARCKFFDRMGKHYNTVADKLEDLIPISPEYEARIRYAQDLLVTHYREWEKSFGKRVASKSTILPTKPLTVPILGNIGQPRAGGPPGKTPSKPQPPPKPGSLGGASSSSAGSIGHMSSHQRGGTTYSGYSFNDMKKYLQIYIRRGMTEKARMVGVELYRINELNDSSAKSNYTSFVNTLKYVALRDVGIASFNVVLGVMHLLNTAPNASFDYIDGAIMDLSSAEKTHLSEQTWKTYKDPKCAMYAERQYDIVVDKTFTDEDNAFIDQYFHSSIFHKDDPTALREYALVFYKRLLDKDLNAIAWWSYFVQTAGDSKVALRTTYYDGATEKKIGGKEPTVILWDIISELYDKEAINTLRWGYFNDVKKEDAKYYYLIAILAIVYDIEYVPFDISPSTDSDDLMSGNYQLELNEPYVVNKSKTVDNVIVPESETFYDAAYADISNKC